MNAKCICLVCYKPNDIWVDFLSTFTKYDIYIVIDDNSIDYKEQYSKFTNINIIQIKNEECEKNGFSKLCTVTIPKKITAWDKAIYYFSSINTGYNNVWFLEDDVFFNNEQTLLNIDSTYGSSDLLSNDYGENISGHKNEWHWRSIDIRFPPPYYCAMVCCVRISSQLLSKIKRYADEHNTLFFIEAFFPSVCKKYKLQYDTPIHFNNILYRKTYIDKDIDGHNLFHPIKDITKHIYYRAMINNNNSSV